MPQNHMRRDPKDSSLQHVHLIRFINFIYLIVMELQNFSTLNTNSHEALHLAGLASYRHPFARRPKAFIDTRGKVHIWHLFQVKIENPRRIKTSPNSHDLAKHKNLCRRMMAGLPDCRIACCPGPCLKEQRG